jgi:hypothetical protein
MALACGAVVRIVTICGLDAPRYAVSAATTIIIKVGFGSVSRRMPLYPVDVRFMA